MCVETQEEGFASIPFDTLCELMQNADSEIRKYFESARRNKMHGDIHFGEEKAFTLKALIDETYIKF